MKADACGGYTEQIRARFGWKSKAERKAAGADLTRNCGNCHFREFKEIARADGGYNFSPYCCHLETPGDSGFATRESAICDKWERRL